MPRLAALRRRKRWTTAELARVADVEAQVIGLIERGAAPRISRTNITRLAEALGVDPTTVAEFRPSLGLASIGQIGIGDGDAPR